MPNSDCHVFETINIILSCRTSKLSSFKSIVDMQFLWKQMHYIIVLSFFKNDGFTLWSLFLYYQIWLFVMNSTESHCLGIIELENIITCFCCAHIRRWFLEWVKLVIFKVLIEIRPFFIHFLLNYCCTSSSSDDFMICCP